ncbi:hypothetical protein ACHQM5_030211 [Ranunculus cassubicifolius]
METKFFFSYALLGILLLSSSLPCLSLSDTNHARRVLKPARTSTIQKFLIPHNRVRAKLGLRPLQWSEKLANFAKSYANQRKKDCALRHSNTNYGENIFWGSGKDWRPSDAVTAWADEKKYYNYKLNSCLQKEDCLHYTQIVWKESLRVGCARVICNSGDTFITCNYDPHGNVIGQKPF